LDTPSGQQVVSAIRDISARKRALDDLAETRRRLVGAREAERVRLAQELHDGPTQSLYGLSFRLAGLADLGGDAALRELGSLQDSLHDATSQLHAVCTSLRPPALVAFGLEPAIRSALDGLMSAHPELAVSVRLARDDNVLRNEVRLALYRIFQEAIANLVRHANAGAVAVTLELDAEAVSIDVADDGAGFVVPERWVEFAREGHLGLVGAAERAEAVGGRLIVTSRPGYGTRVHAVVPLGEDGLLPGAPSRTGS
jgi:signal transduction histidine kinase